MGAINNLDGKKIKDGKVLHNERVAADCYFSVFALYDSADNRFLLYAEMTNGKVHTWSNGVTSMCDATVLRSWSKDEKPPKLDDDLQTNAGYRVYQKPGVIYENHHDDSKTRRDEWYVEVPKEKLMSFVWA